MKLTSLKIIGFQCFEDETSVDLDSFTTLIGANGCGKSAVLDALCRLFGISTSLRSIRRSDFHLPSGKTYDDFEELTLSLEVRLDFPELEGEPEPGNAVPECFNQMAIEAEGETPFCRLRLSAIWFRTSLPEGEIEEIVQWITTSEEPEEDDFKAVRPHERSKIQVLYVPAIRDPAKQLRQASGTILARLMRATKWSEAGKKAIDKAASNVTKTFREEDAVKLIEAQTGETWVRLQDFPELSTVQLRPLESRIEELLQRVDVRFTDSEETNELGIDRLSDGLRSLFYFSLLTASFQIEQQAVTKQKEDDDDEEEDADEAEDNDGPFSDDALNPPMLTLFAVEEPENHLSAHHLGRVVELLKEVADMSTAQVVLTSHSPSILGRVDPLNVRHLRLHPTKRTTEARRIKLPKATNAAFKYIKEAVRAYPELYFSRLVILGEGDSEEIVVRHLAESFDLEADARSISIVPLGGRFVNHFWRLLNDLGIPHVTLLDLDRERDGGGWGRVKYASAQLAKIGVSKAKLYTVSNGNGERVLTDKEISEIHTWALKMPTDVPALTSWVKRLETHNVFFCSPLDLDFSMLSAFPSEYQATVARGPRIPKKTDLKYAQKYAKKLANALTETLKDRHSGGGTYSEQEKKSFIWYAYLFLGQGKPSTHILALNRIEADDLKKNCPPVLKRLIDRVKSLLQVAD